MGNWQVEVDKVGRSAVDRVPVEVVGKDIEEDNQDVVEMDRQTWAVEKVVDRSEAYRAAVERSIHPRVIAALVRPGICLDRTKGGEEVGESHVYRALTVPGLDMVHVQGVFVELEVVERPADLAGIGHLVQAEERCIAVVAELVDEADED